MGRLIEPMGNYTKTPYYIAQTDTAVHCVEELCFVFCRNTFLLDRGIMDMELARWLDKECGLTELSHEIIPLIQKKGSPSVLIGTILEYVGYGTKKEREEVAEALKNSVDLDAASRRKVFADYLVENKRFAQAVAEYERLLEEVPPMDHMMRACLFHNKGVALCRLFAFGEAAEAFLEACKEDPESKESEVQYLAAKRLSLSEEDYIAFVADHKVWHEQSLEVEKRMEMCRMEYEDSDDFKRLEEVLSRNDISFYEELSKTVTAMKGKYREMAAKP